MIIDWEERQTAQRTLRYYEVKWRALGQSSNGLTSVSLGFRELTESWGGGREENILKDSVCNYEN